jgi:hypothetical protein
LSLLGYIEKAEGSHEAIPPIPDIAQQRLLIDLLVVASELFGSAREPSNLIKALDSAYSLFASAFVNNGAILTPGLLELDIPNMVFNFALREGFFPSTHLIGDKDLDYNLLGPKRYPTTRIAQITSSSTSPAWFPAGTAGLQTVVWFRKSMKSSIFRWKAKLVELQIQPTTNPTSDAVEDLKKFREDLLNDYKRRVKDAKGNPYSNRSLYTAKNSGICKPEFYEWVNGKLPAKSMTCTNFERFLNHNEPPKCPETKKTPTK